MPDVRFTRHAEARMRQRGFRNADIGLVLSVATRVADDAFFLSDKDAAREIERRRREIQQLERLRGTKVIVEGESLVTIYHNSGKAASAQGRKHRRVS
ncbi:hypothetical protein LGT41_0005075 [Abyssibius alkaniclasticus]|uniref:hypothetical protein n=1 Tax=Abyssibius alkaniclasticus TaxID=2881234 RepID=UPI0023631ADC|nr:hypothetical protein [Abyssibius alkaniclasticus]UPH72192.1 hypothetical protein LGT41_0005075 [Abyssibius alkaniclasticus]